MNEIRVCKKDEFDGLVYKYNFFSLLEGTIENEMMEVKYGKILASENIYDKLYNKFLNWIDEPNIIDETIISYFLKDIEKDSNQEEEINEI